MYKSDEVLLNYDVKDVPTVSGKCTLNISVDAGSTETRTHIWDNNPKAGVTHGISSAFSKITNDNLSIQSNSDTLYDNMEIVIEDTTEGKKDKLFNIVTIVKGGLFDDLRLPPEKTVSSIGKSMQDTTYINTIANIGLRTYMQANTTGFGYATVETKVTLALPNEDVSSAKRQAEVKERLAGVYMFMLPRCKYAITIVIKASDILLIDEAQAVLGSFRIQSKSQDISYDNVLIVDGGGRSVDLSVMLNGRILARGSFTGKYGGQKFVDAIIEKYINETGDNMPNKEMVLAALDSGRLQDGNSEIDIAEFIGDAKQEVSTNVMNDIQAVLDANDLRMNQLNLVLCTGRLMGVTEYAGKRTVESLAIYLEKAVHKISPNTHVGQLDDKFALVRGLSLARFAFDKKNAG